MSRVNVQIVSTLRNAQSLKNMFREFSKRELLNIPETRFAYSLIMLKRFQDVKRDVQRMVRSPQWDAYKARQCVPRVKGIFELYL